MTHQLFEIGDRLIKQVESGVLLLDWNENLQPHQPFVDKIGELCSGTSVAKEGSVSQRLCLRRLFRFM